jgi:hypothetical protein
MTGVVAAADSTACDKIPVHAGAYDGDASVAERVMLVSGLRLASLGRRA